MLFFFVGSCRGNPDFDEAMEIVEQQGRGSGWKAFSVEKAPDASDSDDEATDRVIGGTRKRIRKAKADAVDAAAPAKRCGLIVRVANSW